jgi:hypothetical protein
MNTDHTQLLVFRPQKKYIWLGLLGVCLWGMALSNFAWAWLLESEEFFRNVPSKTAALFFAIAVPVILVFLNLWLIYAVHFTRVYLSRECIRKSGVFRERTIRIGNVQSLKWRWWPAGGSVVIHGDGIRMTMDFLSYENRHNMISLLRERIPLELQEGDWDEFSRRYCP